MNRNTYIRKGEWMELDTTAVAAETGAAPLETGAHPHHVRQWLQSLSFFPDKWLGRLFSVGGIRWQGDALQLLAFPAADTDKDAVYRKAAAPTVMAAPPVLFEDDFCLVLHKPAGMPVHESHPGHTGTLDEAAARHALAEGDPLPLRHIHRLDEDTSGPVLYAKNELAQLLLDEAMRDKRIDRHYLAVVRGRPTRRQGTVDEPIGKDRHHSSRRIVTSSGDRAVTHYELLERWGTASLLRLQLETGRTHQIRVHMSFNGNPLLGDQLYGGDTRLIRHQALHGESLAFPHPWTREVIRVEAAPPRWLSELKEKLAGTAK
ncbi:RluA family pseudouridine synthase [Paenibacillus protaetiae]|uniref:Pseudouridine synthase n=1 Tax=Paenibacillus protaetiae TaxID=2509456 RepID=A0A4P6ET17_9BACL|nr:RluA family pseudouridine synthase [Paenibacillus protaetiae]QAY65153.1 RluA family pseudouridine synthase [Paenibacillus protaetiae]